MDLIYALYRKHSTTTKSLPECESLHDGDTLCSVSSQNIVAFTTRTELDDLTAKTWGAHVYVADLNTPWYSHKVVSSPAVVTALEWDLPGSKLLIADSSGNVSLWTLKEHVLNDWVCLGTATFTGEHILGAAFFHNGKKISLMSEKKDSVLYSEKFAHVRFAPSVRQFGNRAVEGCLVISTTGMVGALAIPKEGPGLPLITATDSLGSTRHRITALDICYGKNGQLLVAVSNGNIHTPVQCYRVSVKKTDEKCIITSQALPSFFLQASPSADQHYHTVTQLKFVVREDADTLVVSANGEAGALFEVWELREKPLSVHKLFQPKAQSTELYKTVLWQHQSTFRANAQVTCITTLKVSITNTVPPPLYVIMVLADGTIHCLTRDSLKQMASAWLRVGWRDDVKHSKMSINISAMDLTWLGGALVVADTQGQLYVYRLLLPISEPGATLSVPLATTLLEYCLVTGLDWWDILISIRPNMLDAVCDRLSESFSRQPPAVQQFHYVTYLSLKSALYRLVPAGQAKAADLTALLMLHSVATAFKSLLRPSDLASHDKGPAESLQAVMSDSIIDVDKVLLHLEAKEFTVEPSTLQSLHQLIQWVADLALNLLARLPEQRKTTGVFMDRMNKKQLRRALQGKGMSTHGSKVDLELHLQQCLESGDVDIRKFYIEEQAEETLAVDQYELVRDNKAINSVRELLVIIRIWGLLRTSCLPVFVRSAENMDVLSHLFKLLSRLVQSQEPDENLIDDCILLPSQVMIPPLNTATPITAITSPALFHQALPIQLEYNVEPDCLHFVPDLNPVEGAMATDQTVDTIRHIYLGHQPLVVKQCCRCGGKAQLQSCSRTAAIRAWDQRWARACRCGGHWRVHKYV